MHVTRNQISVDSVPELTPGPSRKHLPRGADPGLEGIARGDGDRLVRRDHDHLVDGIWIRPVPLAALEDGGRTRVGGVLLQDAESQEHRLVLFVDTEDPAEDEVVEEYKDKITHEKLGFQGKNSNLQQSYIDELVALKDGEYSKTPIKTTYGYHIVHRLKTATKEDLRGTIIETLSTDLLTEEPNLTYKAFIELRKEKNLTIFDEEINKQYEEYCERVYETNS